MTRLNGVCKWFNNKKGYGFITLENGEDVFVHQSEIYADGFRSLHENEKVELEVIMDNNRKKAIHVTGPNGTHVTGTNSHYGHNNNDKFNDGYNRY